jgi:cyclophilin family peptidyl-prolyl cis-trans isomerase
LTKQGITITIKYENIAQTEMEDWFSFMKNNKNLNKKAAKKKKKMSFNQICGSIIIPVAVVVLAAGLIIFGTNSGKEEKVMTEDNVKVLVEMENGGDFVIELYPEYAPQTVQNFVDLVTDGFYDGVGFHRVVDGFMAQGGDPEGTGMGGSGSNIPGEFAANGFKQNTLSHTRGVISMARSQDPDSASSQFFICYDDASFLDGQYAAFGKVIEGMDTVDGFLDVKRTFNSMGEEASPVEPITMKKVTIIEE